VVPAATLTAYDSLTGTWESADLAAAGTVEIATVLHWDPVRLTAVVQGDFTGDGQMDFAGWNADGYYLVALADGGQYDTEEWVGGFGANLSWKAFLVGDFDGDGKDDIAMLSPKGDWYVAVSTGTSFQFQQWDAAAWTPANTFVQYEVGDFNGDGRADVAALDTHGAWHVGVSMGDSFDEQTWLPGGRGRTTLEAATTVVGDFNGDGLPDLATYLPTGAWSVDLSTGSSFIAQTWETGLPRRSPWRSVHAGDFNGDGLIDIAALDTHGKLWIFTSSASTFTSAMIDTTSSITSAATRIDVGDFNGDGADDVAILHSRGEIELESPANLAILGTATFGRASWVNTFSSDHHEPDHYVNRHRVLYGRSSGAFITPHDVALLRQDPQYFGTIFQAYKFRLSVELGPNFSDLGDEGLAFALATLVAYQSAYYRGTGDPQGYFPRPPALTVDVLLRGYKLVCDEYCVLAAELYRIAIPASYDPDTTIMIAGFSAGPFGNHAQLFYTNGSVSLLGDPTIGLIARADFQDLRAGYHLSGTLVRQLLVRPEATAYMQQALATFRVEVYLSIRLGGYRREHLIYFVDATNEDGTPP
jgi:hypothetical protein